MGKSPVGILSYFFLISFLSAEALELRFGTMAPQGGQVVRELEKAASELKARTSGRVQLKIYASGMLGDERDLVRKMGLGQIDGASLSSRGLVMIEPAVQVAELPLLFESAEEVDYVLEKIWPDFERKFASKGYRILAREEVGFQHWYSTREISTESDFRVRKFWQDSDNRISAAFLAQLRFQAVPIGLFEVEPALTSGRIEVAGGTPYDALIRQWNARFMVAEPWNYAVSAAVFSQAALSKVSDNDRRELERCMDAYGKKMRKLVRKQNDDSEKNLLRKGWLKVQADDALSGQLEAAADTVSTSLAGTVYSQADLDKLTGYLDSFRNRGKIKGKIRKIPGKKYPGLNRKRP